MAIKTFKVPIDESNPKTKFRLMVESEGKTYKLNKVRVNGPNYGEEEAQAVVEERNNNEVFDDQFYIHTVEDLNTFASAIKDGSFEYQTVNFKSDIDLAGVDFTPIDGKAFKQPLTINGNGHTIKNMTIKSGILTSNNVPYGGAFIGQLAGPCTIKNLSFDNANVTISELANNEDSFSKSGNILAVVMAYVLTDTVFENVSVTNSIVKGYGKIGAIAAMSNPKVNVQFKGCAVVSTTLRGAYNIAGLIGLAQRGETSDMSNFTFSNCTVSTQTVLDPSVEYVDIDTTLAEECDLLPANYPIKGKYALLDDYYYAAEAIYGINYGTAKHDCTVVGFDQKIANSEVCINA